MESMELNKFNVLFRCRISQNLYYANAYYTLNDLGLLGSLMGLGFQPIMGSVSEQMCSPTPGMAGSGTWLHLGFLMRGGLRRHPLPSGFCSGVL